MAAQWLNIGLQDALDLTTTHFLNGAKVVLLTGATPITPSTTLAMLTEAAFLGYVRQTATGWSAAALQLDGHWKSSAGGVLFNNSSGAPQTVTGWGIFQPGANDLYIAGYFAAPVTIPDGGAFLFTPSVQDITE